MKRQTIPTVGTEERTLPANLDAERSLLGAIITNNAGLERLGAGLSSRDFYRDAHRRIFTALVKIIDTDKAAADFVTLLEELRRVGDLEDAGGASYVAGLVDGVPRSVNVEHYARIVREKAMLRGIIAAANIALSDAYEAERPSEQILEAVDRRMLELRNTGGRGRLASLAETMPATFARMEHRYAHRGELSGLTSGYPSIDELTLGWQNGDLVIVAARPSIGKTAFLVNMLIAQARLGIKAVNFSLEMRRTQLEDRILAILSGVDAQRIRSGHLGERDFAALGDAMNTMAGLPIHVDDRAGRTVPEIRQACRRMKAESGLDLVVIDYVQLMPGSLERRGATRNEEVTDIATRLKDLADELTVPVLLISQLSRANEKRPDPRPKLSDLRESGALEQIADIVAFLHRRHHRESGTTNFIIEKQRNGPTGTVNLTLDRDTQRFTDGGEDPPEPPAAPRKPRRYDGRTTRALPTD